MKRRILCLLLAVIVMCLTAPVVAHADLLRGSSGEDVSALQQMLYDMGYLSEEPDGKFGARTEAAVKAYQQSVGLEETGVATDDLLEQISQDWVDFQTWIYEQLHVVDGAYAEPFCRMWETEDGQTLFTYCGKHARLWEATCSILMGGDAESAEYSYLEWQAEVISLYNEWISMVSGLAQEEIESNKTLCIQLMEAQLDAMRASYDANGIDIDPTDVYYNAELWMRAHSAWLCQMLSTLAPGE